MHFSVEWRFMHEITAEVSKIRSYLGVTGRRATTTCRPVQNKKSKVEWERLLSLVLRTLFFKFRTFNIRCNVGLCIVHSRIALQHVVLIEKKKKKIPLFQIIELFIFQPLNYVVKLIVWPNLFCYFPNVYNIMIQWNSPTLSHLSPSWVFECNELWQRDSNWLT